MSIQKNKIVPTLATMLIVELSLILSGFWMLGDFSQIRFNGWPLSEWLINYQGGFVRRGLIGEVLYRLFPHESLIPKIYQLTFYLYFIYTIIFLRLYQLSKIRNLSLLILLLLIPGGIFQMSITASFYTRKEILFLILLGLLCLIYFKIQRSHQKNPLLWIWLFVLLAYLGGVILTLSHEAYLFMSFPFVITLFWLLKSQYPREPILRWGFRGFLVLIPMIFLLCTIWHGSVDISENIWDSLVLIDREIISPHSPYTVYGAIAGIGWLKIQNLSTLYSVIVSGGWVYWLFFATVNYLLIHYCLERTLVMESRQKSLQIVSILSMPLIGSMTMFFIGSDWGRWIASMGNHAILLMFTLLGTQATPLIDPCWFRRLPKRLIYSQRLMSTGTIYWMFILYEMIFELPECCVQSSEIWIQYSSFAKIIRPFL
jgi:hypothetical protein